MLQAGGEADLALKALGAERGGELGVEHLEGDRPVVLEVVGQEDRGHAPAPELALERIAVLQPFAKCRYGVGHLTRWIGGRDKIGPGTGPGKVPRDGSNLSS